MLYSFQQFKPKLGSGVFLAEGCKIIGDVTIGSQSSIWFNTVIRGDLAPIYIGDRSNIQDLSVIHVNKDQPVVIEEEVSVGHSVVLHGCTIRKGSLIGMGAIVLNGSEIGEETLVAAGSLIPENKSFPPRVLLMGSPAKIIRELTYEDLSKMRRTVANYVIKAEEYISHSPIDKDHFV